MEKLVKGSAVPKLHEGKLHMLLLKIGVARGRQESAHDPPPPPGQSICFFFISRAFFSLWGLFFQGEL